MMLWFRQCRNNGINYLFSIYYSTAASAATSYNYLLAEILVNSLGFSNEKAISTSANVTLLKPGNNKPQLVINFFQQIGLDKTHIKSLVSSNPRLLFSDVDKTLKPKIKVFQELSLSGTDLAKVIAKSGSFFLLSLDNSIRSNLDYFRKLLGSDDSVAKFIKREPRFLWGINAPKLMSPNILLLQNLGFSSVDIQKLMLWNPRIFTQKAGRLKDIVDRVEKTFFLSRDCNMFIHGVYALVWLDESTVKKRLEIFRSFGWSDSEIFTLVQKLPLCLTRSEAKIRNTLNFLMKELGYESHYLASHPTFLTCSLEKRILPRHNVLKLLNEKGPTKCSQKLYTAVICSESKFLERYVLPFKDEMPEVFDIYIKSRSQ
nr:transcription termination factor MTERF15, mitochondrial-like [Nicotiana tomentosiformis]